MKYLLITADDFGVTHSVNTGTLEGFTKGVIQSSNFMATTPWFNEAVRMTKEYDLQVGVHLTLTCEWSNMRFGPITRAESLMDEQGYFYKSYEELAKSLNVDDVKSEYRAQINKVISAGITPTHLDTHMLPPMTFSDAPSIYTMIHKVVLEVAKEYGLIYTYDTVDLKPVYFDQKIGMTRNNYKEITDQLKVCGKGVHHLICHCAHDTEEMRSLASVNDPVYTWGGQVRQQDLDIITSTQFQEFLKEEEFTLIGIKELLELKKGY